METESNIVKGYTDAYGKACKELALGRTDEICMNAAVTCNETENAYSVRYLNKNYSINAITGEVGLYGSEDEVPITVRVLLLHYLINSGNKPLTGNMISFRDLKNGASIYYPAFRKRAVTPLVKAFGSDIERLYECSAILNGEKEKYGSASATIRVLPMVPVTFVLWKGDEEFEASGNILFDSSVENFLSAEDIVYAGSFGVYELIRLKNVIFSDAKREKAGWRDEDSRIR